MSTTITWNGHSNFMLESGNAIILIDPFFKGNPSATYGWQNLPSPNLVLVTHDHGDHVGDALEICRATKAHLGAVVGTGEKLLKLGLPQDQLLMGIGFNLGGSIEHAGATITMVEALHSSDSGVAAGYIITMPDGITVYHAGDTCLFINMQTWGELFNIDVALLPIGGTFTMDARQAANACKLLNCRKVIPMHYATFPALAKNANSFVLELGKIAPNCEAVVLKPGENKIIH